MGMESIYKMSVILNLVDNLSGNVQGAQDRVSASITKMNNAFGGMQKAGAVMATVGGAILGAGAAVVTSTFDTQDALGELASLGVKDLGAVEQAAKRFSDTWAGTTKADFISAAYDIKSGIASLSDEGIAQFMEVAALTGKATKSTTDVMSSLFATGYGIYKGAYDDMSDLEFGEMFSAGISTAVKAYKTAGTEMASSISTLGATATNNNVSLEEQLAILGQLQTTMSGSEAATKYKSFLNQAAAAGEKLGLTFLDSNNQLLSTPEILNVLKTKYGETIDAVEKQSIKEAFGSDEAVAMIDLLYHNVDALDGGIQNLQSSMSQGVSVTQEMAQAIQNTPAQKFQTMQQQIHNNVEELAQGLLPAVNEGMDKISSMIQSGSDWIANNQKTVESIMKIVTVIGIILIASGGFLTVFGTIGKACLLLVNGVRLVAGAIGKMNLAFLSSPVTWVVIGIVALVAAFALLWNKSEAFRNFWITLFDSVKSTFSAAWNTMKPALVELGQCFMNLYQAVQPVLKVLGAVLGTVLTVGLGFIMGFVTGAVNALTPIIQAFSSLVSFVTNIINAIGALFRGDFSGALKFASDAVEDFKNFFKHGFDAIKSFIDGFASGFKNVISGAFRAVDNMTGGKLSLIKNKFKMNMSQLADGVKEKMNVVKNTAKETLSSMLSAYQEKGGGIKGAAAAIAEGAASAFSNGYKVLDTLTGGKLSKMKSTYEEHGGGIRGAAAAVAEGAASAFSSGYKTLDNITGGKLSKMKSTYEEHGGGIKGAAAAVAEGAANAFSKGYKVLDTLTGGKLSKMKSTYEEHGGGIKGAAAAVAEGVTGTFKKNFDLLDSLTDGKLSKVKESLEGKAGAVKGAAVGFIGGVKSSFEEGYNKISSLTSGALSNVKSTYESNGGGIKGAAAVVAEGARGVFDLGYQGIKNLTEGCMTNMKTAYETNGGGIKGAATATMEGVKTVFSNVYDSINNLTGGRLEIIRSTISGKIQAAHDTVIGILDGIKEGFTTKLDAAKNAVSTAIETIKGFFNFSWNLPSIKIPKFSITGGFSLNPPSVPDINIVWNKNGGIMTQPTIFGGAGNKLLGGGEAGAEAILPLSLLWDQMTNIIGNLFSGEDTQDVGGGETGKDIIKSVIHKSEKVSKESGSTESVKDSKDSGIHIGQLTIQVDISKIKDLDMLEKLINELKDAQNRTEPQPV